MDPHLRERLQACVDTISHIDAAIAAGELDWARALTEATLLALDELRQRAPMPIDAIRQGAVTGVMTPDKEHGARGRALNALIGAAMGWWVGQLRNQTVQEDIQRLIDALEKTRDLLREHAEAAPQDTPQGE